jgi:hypothetical protein
MTEHENTLLEWHAEHGLEGLMHHKRFRKLCDEHVNDNGFNATLDRIQELQRAIERSVEAPGLTPRGQVEAALKLVSNLRGDKERADLFERLVELRCAKRWGDVYAKYFAKAAPKVRSWHHYFLSFTSHSEDGADLAINQAYRKLIRAYLRREVGPKEAATTNLFAELLDRLLRDDQLKGFYYVKHQDSRDVEKMLKEEAERSFAFVQIVERKMFGDRSPNYCFIEYGAAGSDPEKDLIFVMPGPREEFIAEDLVHFPLLPWYERAMSKQAVVVPEVKRAAEADAAADHLRREVIARVNIARLRVYKEIPL